MAERRRRLLLVSHHPLELAGGGTVRWRYFAEALPQMGWDVEVASGGSARLEPGDVAVQQRLRRVRRAARASARVGQRAVRAVAFEPAAFVPDPGWMWRGRGVVAEAIARTRPDVVYATVPPAVAMFPAARVAARAGVPYVLEFRDLWGGNPGNDAGKPWLARLQARAIARAARVVVTTPEARDRLAELHPRQADRLVVLPNGFHPRLLGERPAHPPSHDPPLLVHAGHLYGSRSIEGLTQALARPELRGRARLVFVGSVNDRGAAAIAAVDGLVDVEIRPTTTWEEAIAATRDAAVAVVLFTPGDETAVPGKLYEALALGTPVLALTGRRSALANQVQRMGLDAGLALHDQPEQIAAALAHLLDDPPAPVAPERLAPFSRERVAADLVAILEDVAG